MKRRWSVLFWLSLATLIGLSWLASSFGIGIMSMMNVALAGTIAAAIIAFVALLKDLRHKWPAIAVLVCSAPFGIQTLQLLPDLPGFITYLGAPIAVVVVGNVATIGCAIVLLVMKPPVPPVPPPVAPARVVD